MSQKVPSSFGIDILRFAHIIYVSLSKDDYYFKYIHSKFLQLYAPYKNIPQCFYQCHNTIIVVHGKPRVANNIVNMAKCQVTLINLAVRGRIARVL